MNELVTLYSPMAVRLASAIVGNRTIAEDVAQDALVRAVQRVGDCREPRVFGGWLARIVVSTARNEVRRAQRASRRDTRWYRQATVDHADGVEEVAIAHVGGAAANDRLFAALQGIADADREVLAARFVAGLSERETAAALDVAVGTVKSRTSRALARLRAVLGEEVGS